MLSWAWAGQMVRRVVIFAPLFVAGAKCLAFRLALLWRRSTDQCLFGSSARIAYVWCMLEAVIATSPQSWKGRGFILLAASHVLEPQVICSLDVQAQLTAVRCQVRRSEVLPQGVS